MNYNIVSVFINLQSIYFNRYKIKKENIFSQSIEINKRVKKINPQKYSMENIETLYF